MVRNATGDFDGAIADISRAIELDPKVAAAYYWRGLAKRAKQDLMGANADFDRAIAIDPKFANTIGRPGAK